MRLSNQAVFGLLAALLIALAAGGARADGLSWTESQQRLQQDRIDWQRSARQIYNLVRAVTHPYPGAFGHWEGRPLYVWAAAVAAPTGGPPPQPGTVVGADEGLLVQTGAGRLRVLRVQAAGGDEVPALEWARRDGVTEGMILT